jgi:hypothetical protein
MTPAETTAGDLAELVEVIAPATDRQRLALAVIIQRALMECRSVLRSTQPSDPG